MNPSTALGRVLVDELARSGVRDVVLSPGSRSAALALALHAADARGELRLHVRIDERSAGFLALGLAKGSHRPVVVVTTSGTAAANLHPAVLEAAHARVPLIAMTADRPAELRGTEANQTTDQVKLFGDAVRAYVEVAAPDVVPDSAAPWRAAVSRVVAAAVGRTGEGPMARPAGGPVHVNVAFREPLLPDPDDVATSLPQALAGRPGGAPWRAPMMESPPLPGVLPLGPRTVVVAGDDAGPPARLLAEEAGWPLFAEPSSGARTGTHPIATYRLLLGLPELAERIERVVVLGRPTLSRPITRLLSRPDVEVVVVGASPFPDPGNRVAAAYPAVRVDGSDDPGWLEEWRRADVATLTAVEKVVLDGGELNPWQVARTVSGAVKPGDLLVVGSSNPIRDLDLMALPYPVGERRMVMANRGLAGIDGVVSTAIGAALGRRSSHALAYMGDLTFLHDSNGLVIGPDEPRPDLTIVVASDDGGSIFSTLEQGGAPYASAFERVFGTPTRVDIGTLCQAMGVDHRLVTTSDELEAALDGPAGIQVVEARVGRADRREADQQLRSAARLH
ncbi:2-succinyl-5-enolpyruvyl-6-hydroxy-3-cyclohexene-1-carboxylic-acid synthase [Mumia sp. zg.B21]|uniref:2-succinyl-5-enolpyruvyl-6-hydroxy-3- cyclohexene-1-carboxylic-acid synthase n=1 Tax=Mumia sp. zg.B21 TaxID=2855447 RepID=UPI001C6DF686|nr:2-succinyl-5-enolpyruvyl-6-hydroxy-3-cyclohexene-1-carboxylic-acid synthase [Mumia sp. zg.B21]MBW9209427.1 2-succinyl-5-enolpyruvyl-6-hydroxy-3-cyclohexene-1-carboxylic-acid synthase [Mumia sp. zg.B21]